MAELVPGVNTDYPGSWEREVLELRSKLAAVKAEGEHLSQCLDALRELMNRSEQELTETRKALQYACLFPVNTERKAELDALNSARASEAALRERVTALVRLSKGGGRG